MSNCSCFVWTDRVSSFNSTDESTIMNWFASFVQIGWCTCWELADGRTALISASLKDVYVLFHTAVLYWDVYWFVDAQQQQSENPPDHPRNRWLWKGIVKTKSHQLKCFIMGPINCTTYAFNKRTLHKTFGFICVTSCLSSPRYFITAFTFCSQ